MEIKLFINGQFKDSSDKIIKTSFDPSNGAEVAKYHVPSAKDIEEAVQAANNAFYNPTWKNMSQDERADLLLKISEKIKERAKEIVDIEVRDSGSTLRKAKADVHNTSAFFKVMSKVARELKLSVKDEAASRAGFSINSREFAPIGVCAQIIPWNFPLVMAGWKIGPILATGCTTVLKSAEETPASAAILAEIIRDAGVPAGVVNIITGGADVGRALISHPLVKKVAFTGSTQVGKEILKNTAGGVLNATMELGGKSANIVLNDADLSIAVDGALYAFLYHSGQACDSGTRLLVQEGIYPEFMEKFLARIKDVKVAPTTDPNAGYGPVVSEKQNQKMENFFTVVTVRWMVISLKDSSLSRQLLKSLQNTLFSRKKFLDQLLGLQNLRLKKKLWPLRITQSTVLLELFGQKTQTKLISLLASLKQELCGSTSTTF